MRFSRIGFLIIFAALMPVPRFISPLPAETRPVVMEVDARQAPLRLFHARLVIPAAPGRLALVYPKWIPGEHGPTGPVTDLAGVTIKAGGNQIGWRRDELEMYRIICEVPKGVSEVELALDFLSAPPAEQGFSSAASTTTNLAVISWNQLLLYPELSRPRELSFEVSLKLPQGWSFSTALAVAQNSEAGIRFEKASLERLIDSPLLCGVNFRRVDITPPDEVPHFIDIACDSRAGLAMTGEQIGKYRRLVREARTLFGTRHYDSYRFLLSLSNGIAHFGLEHHESSDDRSAEDMLTDQGKFLVECSLLTHEFIHSWNGKYRRPAGMVRPSYQQPLDTGLLWVYEGLTHYLTMVLTARSGLWTEDQCRQALAVFDRWVEDRQGRRWRPLEDTAVAAQLLYEARRDQAAWRRGVDFYREGIFLWLEVDALIRQKTGGKKSFDDFCRQFFSGTDGSVQVVPYTLDDIVFALDRLAPYDWKAHLESRVQATGDQSRPRGLEAAGWKLAYAEEKSEYFKAFEGGNLNLAASIGAEIGAGGVITDVIPGSAAQAACLAPGMQIVAVNRRAWAKDLMEQAVAETGTEGRTLELIAQNNGFFDTYRFDYYAGARYPVLVRDDSRPDLLSRIITPLTR